MYFEFDKSTRIHNNEFILITMTVVLKSNGLIVEFEVQKLIDT